MKAKAGFPLATACILFLSCGFHSKEGKSLDDILHPNQTSASLLVQYTRLVASQETGPEKRMAERKLLIIYDLYIKARSYAFLNKLFFLLSIVSALGVLIWPSLDVILTSLGKEKRILKSAIIQTTITGVAALTFTFHSQYKNKQMFTENLMRYSLFSEERLNTLSQKVIEEMTKIDKGFSFSDIISKNEGG